jgi:UDP-N-acetylglucosamine 1-carboxyvinyltransferase
LDRFRITGPSRLRGEVRASGAKNAALPALAVSLLTTDPLHLVGVPRVRDLATMRRLLEHLGVEATFEESEPGTLSLVTRQEEVLDAPYDLVKTMRAGVLVLGPLLARRGEAVVSLPGGCAIGVRPIDQHLAGLAALGAEVRLEHGYVHLRAPRLRGARFRFAGQTVTGTENVLMAACLAEGTSVLENCACEPEVTDLARLLVAMGARIEGIGSSTLTVEGVDQLVGARHTVIPDRIEAGTYLVGAVLTGGDVWLRDGRAEDLAPLLDLLAACGAVVERHARCADGTPAIRVRRGDRLLASEVATAPHPGFPTDLQAQWMVLMTQAEGTSRLSETVFENRFQHVPELARMGARIDLDGRDAHIHGPTRLSGANVMATDLRASACLVLAGLVAEGETVVDRIYHLDRGYEAMERKLRDLGAAVERIGGGSVG